MMRGALRVVYVAGPFTAETAWGVEQNVRRAEEVGLLIAEHGGIPLIPHANIRYFNGLKTPEFWYNVTLGLLRRCDAIVMVPGWKTSKGALRELAEASRLGMPAFDISRRSGLEAFCRWLAETSHSVEVLFDRQSPRFACERQEKRGLK